MWFLADHCNATFGYCHEMSSVCLSSVTRVYCGQMVSWIRMPLGMQVDLGPGHIVLDGDPAPPLSKGHSPPILGPYLLRLNGCMDEDVTWYGGRPWPKWLCIRWGPSSTHPKGHSSPPQFFRPMSIVAKRLHGPGCLVVFRYVVVGWGYIQCMPH